MIIIDGSQGWGQVLRTSIALSSLLLEPIKVTNIRATRSRPGLMPQHFTGIKVAGEFCNAETKNVQFGSMEIEYNPRSLNVESRSIDIGTSGSIPLLLQTLIPLLLFANKKTTLEIRGGTAGLGSPNIEYLKHVTFPILEKMWVKKPQIEIIKQGFYPRGGGEVSITLEPIKKLNALNLTDRGEVLDIQGFSIAGGLPLSVAERQTQAAEEFLKSKGYTVDIQSESVQTFSQGTSITLEAICENSILGADAIGKRGFRAEDIGRQAAEELYKSIQSKAALDKWMGDQIIPFLALADGNSTITVEEITEHLKTNISVAEKILGVNFKIDGNRVEVSGASYVNKII